MVTDLLSEGGYILVPPNKPLEFKAIGSIQLVIASFATEPSRDRSRFTGFAFFNRVPIDIEQTAGLFRLLAGPPPGLAPPPPAYLHPFLRLAGLVRLIISLRLRSLREAHAFQHSFHSRGVLYTKILIPKRPRATIYAHSAAFDSCPSRFESPAQTILLFPFERLVLYAPKNVLLAFLHMCPFVNNEKPCENYLPQFKVDSVYHLREYFRTDLREFRAIRATLL